LEEAMDLSQDRLILELEDTVNTMWRVFFVVRFKVVAWQRQ
jgi:hypothetical protein